MEYLKSILDQFKSITELKFDCLNIDSSCSLLSNKINVRRLTKLTIYNNENDSLNMIFLNLSSMSNLRYIRIPQISLPDYSHMPKQLETLILTDCRHLDLMCPGANQGKVKLFEKQFNSNNIDYLYANSDGKCLTIQRLKDFFHQFV